MHLHSPLPHSGTSSLLGGGIKRIFDLLLQPHVEVVHFDAPLVGSVSLSLVVAMELKNAVMAVMRLIVVSFLNL